MDTTTRNRTSWGEGRIAFLANKEKVRELIDQGWSLSKIYKEHGQSFGGLSYNGFTRCVRLYLENKPVTRKATEMSSSPVASPTPARPTLDSPTGRIESSPPRPVFQKGNRIPNPDDLI